MKRKQPAAMSAIDEKDFVVNPVPERHGHAAESLLTLASLEGRLPDRLDGRPRRTRVIPFNLRKKFMEVLDDDGKSKILVYVTEDGKVRRDVEQVQSELDAAGEYRGMKDTWEVNINEMMDDAPIARKRKISERDDDYDQFDNEDEEKEEKKVYDEVLSDDEPIEEDSDGEYVPDDDEEEEEESESEEEEEDDEEDEDEDEEEDDEEKDQ